MIRRAGVESVLDIGHLTDKAFSVGWHTLERRMYRTDESVRRRHAHETVVEFREDVTDGRRS